MSSNAMYFLIKPKLTEDSVWNNDVRPLLEDLPDNVINIWHYTFTEMFNNAIDHSEGSVIWVQFERDEASTKIVIGDDGEGIFNRIRRVFRLSKPRDAILELAKGKLTTDPANHSGQGIFFSSRMVDTFLIMSRGLIFVHDDGNTEDWLIKAKQHNGTSVIMQLSNSSRRKSVDVFDLYSSTDGDYDFCKTVVPVKLASEEGKSLVSRSQAKKLVARIDKFQNVVFDFQGVTHVGQGFADQVFRIFARDHPELNLQVINASDDVLRVIAHVQSGTS